MSEATTTPAQAAATQQVATTTHTHLKDRSALGFWGLVLLMGDVILGTQIIMGIIVGILRAPHKSDDLLQRGAMISAEEVLVLTIASLVWFTMRARHESEMARLTSSCGGDCSERYLEGYRKSIAVMLLNIGGLIVVMAFKLLAK